MSIKDLFSKTSKVISSQDEETLGQDAESERYIVAEIEDQQRFEPHVDYSDETNFAFYGSAEKYYSDAFSQIYHYYPYDGSRAEQKEFLNSSNSLTRYVFNNIYPRSTGYAMFSAGGFGTPVTKVYSYGAPNTSADYEYITIVGGPHTASNGMENVKLASSFSASNIYNTDIYEAEGLKANDRSGSRLSNLRFWPSLGTSIEFWLKKDGFSSSNTNKEVIFDLWNGEASSSVGYGRFTFELTGTADGTSPFRLTYLSGTKGINNVAIGTSLTTSSVADGEWDHYAVTVQTSSAGLKARLYVNGDLNATNTYVGVAYNMGEVTGSLKANIGALRTMPSGNIYTGTAIAEGWGKFSGSLDEFRYWKSRRDSKEIGRNWFTQIRGGSNNDISNADLGVYFKFNEGITADSSLDSVVLDYSGRISNGVWTGYTSNSRNTGSAMISSSAASSEFEDPIMRSSHPTVVARKDQYEQSGSLHDQDNNASLLYSLPEWILEEDRNYGDGTLQNLVQLVGGYFDELHLLIKELPKIKNIQYYGSGSKPYPFSNHLLQNMGMVAPNVFVDSTVLQQFLSRDEDREYNDTLANTKNLIYQNIYNNLVYIFKTKGTEKSFRNLLRCYGISDELINVNVYADNNTYKFDRKFRTVSQPKRYVNFYDPDKFESTVYQYADPFNSNTVSFISGTIGEAKEVYMGLTVESEVFFPKRFEKYHPHHFYFGSTTSSFFGMHGAEGDVPLHTTWPASDFANFQVMGIRPDTDSKDIYFRITASNTPFAIPELTSSLFKNVFDNQRWNFAVRISPDKTAGRVSGSTDTTYTVHFDGLNMEGDVIQNEFSLTGSMTSAEGKGVLKSAKRLYIGANRTNFTGSTVYPADARISSLRYWAQSLPFEAIKDHARDPFNVGSHRPYENAFPHTTNLKNPHIPNIDTLVLNWDFSNVTGSSSDPSATTTKDSTFYVNDISSGSANPATQYGWLNNIIKKQHSGKGNFFLPPESGDSNPIDKTYLTTYRQQLPEVMSSADTINILDNDDKNFARDKDLVTTFHSIEKSMYQTISKEMINMFASIVDFNNIVGEPVNRYRQDYKDLGKLRQLFFEKVQNTPSLDKYLEFYKWLDSSVNIILRQIVPASANISDHVKNIVESHVLERNKVQAKFPTIEFKVDDPEFGLKGISELGYNWKFGHAPIGQDQADNADWWKHRAERDEPLLKSSDTNVNTKKESIREIINTYREPSSVIVSDTESTLYSGSTYALRRFTKPYRFDVESFRGIKGGTNFHQNKNLDFARHAVYPAGPIRSDATYTMLPLNLMIVDSLTNIDDLVDINDVRDPNELKKYTSEVLHGRDYEDGYSYSIKSGEQVLPFNIVSSSVTTGYNLKVVEGFKSGTSLVNIHNDVYGYDKETPMQSPFTNQWVGGLQYRHVDVNRATAGRALDTNKTRPEGFVILLNNHPDLPPDSLGTLGVAGADYPHPEIGTGPEAYPSFYPKATFTRDGLAKRPVNIANIKYDTSSLSFGNYRKSYELLTLNGRKKNNFSFIENEGLTLPSYIKNKDNLKQTTNVNTLVGISASNRSAGNLHVGPFSPLITETRGSRFINNGVEQTQYTLPNYNSTKAVITSRFSAPGGADVMSRGFLDIGAEERSVYNAMSFRNLAVRSSGSGESGYMRVDSHINTRDGLATLLRRRSGLYGLDSVHGVVHANHANIYAENPSFHKIYRNKLQRIEYNDGTNTYGGIVATVDKYDNWYIQHQIPRNEANYAWIKKATHPKDLQRMVGGYAPKDGLFSGSADGWDSALVFITASEVGSYFLSNIKFGRNDVHETAPQFLPTDFAGLNTHIVNILTSSANTLGHTSSINLLMNSTYIDAMNTGDDPELFNAMLLNRGSLYGFASWKQIRNDYHPVVRGERRSNGLSLVSKISEPVYITHIDGSTEYLTPRYGSLQKFERVMPVSSRYNTIKQTVLANVDGTLLATTVTLESDYGNQLSYFDNEDLDNLLAPKETPTLPYHSVLHAYNGTAPTEEIAGISSVFYEEKVYPSAINMYTSRVRGRESYNNAFWRSDPAERINLGIHESNEFGFDVSRSIWPLDVRIPFLTQSTSAPLCGNAAGILQNTSTTCYPGQNQTALLVGPLYARKHCLASALSVVGPSGIPIPETASALTKATYVNAPASATNSIFWLGRLDMYHGDAHWDAPANAGRYTYTISQLSSNNQLKVKGFTSEPVEPWFNSYDDFALDLRAKNKDMSVIPEFRISQHIEDIYDNGDINMELGNIFEIPHAGTSSTTVPQNASQDDFYTIFSNADFLKKFSAVKADHDGILPPSQVSLTCKVLKKFVPYDGFYPAQRTVQLATRLSQSYYSYISAKGNNAYTSNIRMRPFLQPLFAPGIMYNSIKAGIACDWPLMLHKAKMQTSAMNIGVNTTSSTIIPGLKTIKSATAGQLDMTLDTGTDYYSKLETSLVNLDLSLSITSSNSPIAELWDTRLPFEAIVEPERYIAGIDLLDHEPDVSASINCTSLWSGQGDNLYKLMTSNFLAEVPEFFLKDSAFTNLQSSGIPTSGMEFESGSIWGARIKIRRTMNQARDWQYEHGLSASNYAGGVGEAHDKANPLTDEIKNYSFSNWTNSASFELPQDPKSQSGLYETFTMYSRPSAFGPAVAGRSLGTSDGDKWLWAFSASVSGALDCYEGYNWSYTPPYYHGETWADIIFEPDRTGTYTVEEFFNEARTIHWRVDAGIEDPRPTTPYYCEGRNLDAALPSSGSAQPQLVPNNTSAITGKTELYSGRNINANAMKLDSSFNIFGLKKVNELGSSLSPAAHYWVIEPKFETPMLNFGPDSVRGVRADNGTLSLPIFGSESVARGMWHQFGLLPAGDEGVYVEIDDIPTNWLQNHPSLKWDDRYGRKDVFDGLPETDNSGFSLTPITPISSSAGAELNRLLISERLQSLTEKFGFTQDNKSQRLGEVSSSKIVREAIVAVPFVQTSEGRQFFSLDKDLVKEAIDKEVNNALSMSPVAGESINQMIRSMNRYVFPPTMNFIDNDKVDPFAMYIFEFEHKFSKEDLANIWQNLPPFDYRKMREESATITHNLASNEIFGSEGFEDKTQWMVFKVKQKARNNYFDKVSTSRSGTELKTLEQNPGVTIQSVRGIETPDIKVGNDSVRDYSYNWPYDYFSTIEMASIDAGINLSNTSLVGPPSTATLVDIDVQATEVTGVTTVANPLNVTTVAATSGPSLGTTSVASPATPTNTAQVASPSLGTTSVASPATPTGTAAADTAIQQPLATTKLGI